MPTEEEHSPADSLQVRSNLTVAAATTAATTIAMLKLHGCAQ
jgi:hypothetical protein